MEPAPELVPFAQRVMKNFMAGETGAIIDAIAQQPGSLLIGTDDEEWYEGFDTISAFLRVQLAESQAVADLDDTDMHFDKIIAWKEGSVGWITCHVRALMPGVGPHSGRITLVVHEEGAHWRIVQWHGSIAVTNEAVWGHSLTTSVDEILELVKDYQSPTAAIADDGTVAIMFTDIVGSTAMMEELGEHKWLEVLEWHSDVVSEWTAIFGGTVVKGQGDGFMLAFPAIGTAAACAIALQKALREGLSGVTFEVRMGIHCGNAKSDSGDFFGRTVVVAARLTGQAGGGEILISQLAQGGLGRSFSLGEARSLSLKGLAGEYAVSTLLWR